MKRKRIGLDEHFTLGKLLRYSLPTVVMMIFTSIYGVVDGFFISNFAGKAEFTGANIIMPFLMILTTFGFMFGSGGSALIAKLFGQKKNEEANQVFSLIIVTSIVLGVLVAILSIIFIPLVATTLKAEGEIHTIAVKYGRIVSAGVPFCILQFFFHPMFSAAEKPKVGLYFTLAAGFTNMLLDGLFLGIFGWGVQGAAWATVASQVVGGVGPLIYFFAKNGSLLRITTPYKSLKPLVQVTYNGSSELLCNISMSLVSIFYNIQLLSYIGEDGVAAYGVLMYVGFIFSAAFIGFSSGTAPIVSFNYGANNRKELRSVLKKSLLVIGVCSLIMCGLAEALAVPLSLLYVGYDKELLELTIHAFRLSSFQFLFMGYAIYGSGFFTALNNGLVSALISFLRTIVFQTTAVFLFPLFLGADGIWVSIIGAELLCAILVFSFLLAKEKPYHYGFWKRETAGFKD